MAKGIRSTLYNLQNSMKDSYDRRWIKLREKMAVEFYDDPYMDRAITEDLTDDEKRQVDEYYTKYYGKPVTHRFHQAYKNYSGQFHKECFVETLYGPKLIHFVNDPAFVDVISDKNFLPVIAETAGVKMPEVVIYSVRDVLFDKNHDIISKEQAEELLRTHTDLIVKPTFGTCGGSQISFFTAKDGYVDGLDDKAIQSIFDTYKTDFTVQKLVKQHKDLKDIYPDSLNTIRLVTYYLKGEIKSSLGTLRMGRGGSRLDNSSSGGLYMGVRRDGTLLDDALDYNTEHHFSEHPDTHLVFKDHRITHYQDIVEAAKRAHRLIPQLGFIDWDFSLDEDGNPVLIEANCRNGGGLEFVQYCHGTGFFEEDTPYVLQWMAEHENMSLTERKKKRIHL